LIHVGLLKLSIKNGILAIMSKIIDVFDYLHEKMRISPDNILFIRDLEFDETQFSPDQMGDVMRFLKKESAYVRDNRRLKSHFVSIPVDHEKRLKYLTGTGFPFMADFYTIIEFSSKEDFFKAYEKFKTGRTTDKNLSISKISVPPTIGWSKITIKFLSYENVLIFVDKDQKEATFESMGFVDRRNGRPNDQWELLYLLAKNRGQFSWGNNLSLTAKEQPKLQKRKQGLSKALKEYFGLKDDPFYPYQDEMAYRIKLRLMPTQDSEPTDSDELGIKSYYRDQTPSKYEDEFSSE
jgi:hypothetical protein